MPNFESTNLIERFDVRASSFSNLSLKTVAETEVLEDVCDISRFELWATSVLFMLSTLYCKDEQL